MATPSSVELPSSDSPYLALLHPTTAEKHATWHLNGQSWRGPLSIDAYIRREKEASLILAPDGAISFWILVDTSTPASIPRRILASCETFRKRALIVRRDQKAEEAVSHGIGSVFCDPQLRGRGYAGRMMKELGKELDTWQHEEEKRTHFSVLFSDIGKKFYAKHGWHPFSSSHITLSPLDVGKQDYRYDRLPAAKELQISDLPKLCDIDKTLLRSMMEERSSLSSKIQVALIPDLRTYWWHHARECCVALELTGRVPEFTGAIAKVDEGKRVWCIWTHAFGDSEVENILYILRLVIEDEIESSGRDGGTHNQLADQNGLSRGHILSTASVLGMARREAVKWGMKHVQIWNPSPLTILAAQEIEPSARVTHREQESIASLRWHAEAGVDVEWVANGKFAWC